MTSVNNASRKIAIIGAGFSGTALAAQLARTTHQPLEIYLFEKTGQFGAGDAYRTPFPYHLLNARAGDMSAFEDAPSHFSEWLSKHVSKELETDVPIARQFVPRIYYHQYLRDLLEETSRHPGGSVRLELIPEEVVNMQAVGQQMKLTMKNRHELLADKVVLALGNNPPSGLPFPVADDIKCIDNPWDYTALNAIPADDPVLIVGTGLSMVDAVLTLHHQKHRGHITAVSRRGLLPLPHSETCSAVKMDTSALPRDVRSLMKTIRHEAKKLTDSGGDWRGLMSAMRLDLQDIWRGTSEACRKRFLRHVLPYWNIHRHRVHVKLYDLLTQLQQQGQLEVMAGRVLSAKNGEVKIRQRQSRVERTLPVKYIINCMGSSFEPSEQPLLQSLLESDQAVFDPLQLGVEISDNYALKAASGNVSPHCFVIGPLMRGEVWECIAVPEIRKQCKELAKTLLHDA